MVYTHAQVQHFLFLLNILLCTSPAVPFCAVFPRVLGPPSLHRYNRLLTVSAAPVAVSEAPSYTDKDKDLADVYREEMANC